VRHTISVVRLTADVVFACREWASTQYVGQQPKGHWGNSENTGGDPHGRRQGRECVCTNGAAGRQTQLEELKKHQHARCEATREQTRSARTGDEGGASAGIQRHLAAGVVPCRQSADWVLGVRLACGYAARSSLRSRRPSSPSGPKPQCNILYYCIIADEPPVPACPTATAITSTSSPCFRSGLQLVLPEAGGLERKGLATTLRLCNQQQISATRPWAIAICTAAPPSPRLSVAVERCR
jgi:hypothetical protein